MNKTKNKPTTLTLYLLIFLVFSGCSAMREFKRSQIKVLMDGFTRASNCLVGVHFKICGAFGPVYLASSSSTRSKNIMGCIVDLFYHDKWGQQKGQHN